MSERVRWCRCEITLGSDTGTLTLPDVIVDAADEDEPELDPAANVTGSCSVGGVDGEKCGEV